jgi:hypothetical protein
MFFTRVAGTRVGTIFATSRGNLKYKWAIGLLCVLLFVAAVDTIPDPPAINPPVGHSASVFGLHLHGSFTLLELKWSRGASSLQRPQVDRFWYRLALDSRPAGISPLPKVYHATDTSPPEVSLVERSRNSLS